MGSNLIVCRELYSLDSNGREVDCKVTSSAVCTRVEREQHDVANDADTRDTHADDAAIALLVCDITNGDGEDGGDYVDGDRKEITLDGRPSS